jgi:hypothetical protein
MDCDFCESGGVRVYVVLAVVVTVTEFQDTVSTDGSAAEDEVMVPAPEGNEVAMVQSL